MRHRDRMLLLIILLFLLVFALPTWPYSTGWGYYPSGLLGLLLIVLLVLALADRRGGLLRR
jgi:peptidoglycan/LPS O-acetylase OafA/YrhL